MKLYRGIKTTEFLSNSPAERLAIKKLWLQLLQRREKRNFIYPESSNKDLINALHFSRLERQYFTDRKEIAQAYAKSNQGILVEIELPVEEIQKHFRVEFQNFAQRRKSFELVYVVDSPVLEKYSKKWGLRITESASRLASKKRPK